MEAIEESRNNFCLSARMLGDIMTLARLAEGKPVAQAELQQALSSAYHLVADAIFQEADGEDKLCGLAEALNKALSYKKKAEHIRGIWEEHTGKESDGPMMIARIQPALAKNDGCSRLIALERQRFLL